MATFIIKTPEALDKCTEQKKLKLTSTLSYEQKYFQVFTDEKGDNYLFDIANYKKEPHIIKKPIYPKQSFEGKMESVNVGLENLFDGICKNSEQLDALAHKLLYPQEKLKEYIEKFATDKDYEDALAECAATSSEIIGKSYNLSSKQILSLTVSNQELTSKESYSDIIIACQTALQKLEKAEEQKETEKE